MKLESRIRDFLNESLVHELITDTVCKHVVKMVTSELKTEDSLIKHCAQTIEEWATEYCHGNDDVESSDIPNVLANDLTDFIERFEEHVNSRIEILEKEQQAKEINSELAELIGGEPLHELVKRQLNEISSLNKTITNLEKRVRELNEEITELNDDDDVFN